MNFIPDDYREKRFWIFIFTDSVIWACVITSIMLLCGCLTAPDRTHITLENAGFTDIDVKGWAPFQCADDDWFETEFTAKNAAGEMIQGAVCCELISSKCSVRIEF